ncbi:MAG: dienelactone hydrolase family protein [Myxococcaceae bacterium]|nr:dienelactone hydrolase family protein [Myxococcaceae bacterium]
MRALLLAVLFSLPASAAVVAKTVAYEVGKTKMEGILMFDDSVKTPRPGLVVVPNWLGINLANIKQAEGLVGTKYVLFIADMYGKDGRPKNQEEAGKAAGAVKGDRKLMRERAAKALEVLKAQAKIAPLDVTKLGAFGFCFGGTSVLELARSGAKLAGVVSLHGGLDTPNPADAKNITGKVLALHGADDPFVPAKDVAAFEDEMRAAKIDWQLVKYGNSVHSFTDVDANAPGQAMYNPSSAKRAYEAMDRFFAEAFGG